MCFKATFQVPPVKKENPYKSLTIKDLNIRFYKNIDDIADFKHLPSSQKFTHFLSIKIDKKNRLNDDTCFLKALFIAIRRNPF